MRADVILDDETFTIEFTPEPGDDPIPLKVMGDFVKKAAYRITTEGFQYMDPKVRFVLYRPTSRSD